MEGSGPDSPPEPDDNPLTKRDLQALLLDATADIKAHTATELERHVRALKTDIEALSRRTHQAETRLTVLAETSSSHSQDLTYLHGKIATLEEELEDLNNRSRRNNIRVRGLPETVTHEALHSTITDLFGSLLPEASEGDLAMDRVHRALRAPTLNPDTPRDVIAHMHRFPIKEQLLQKARQHPPSYRNRNLAFFHDLAPSTLKKRRDLRQLTTTLAHYGIKYMWGHPFKSVVRKDDQTFILSSASEMAPFAASLGLELLPPPVQRMAGMGRGPGSAADGADNGPRRTPRKRMSEVERSPRRQPRQMQN
ncbi:Hypothetical predicted protein [Pelobates cultripes]|uniref:L1 transposable element RRM domain-containing protein n=1 Tax=Pelobates cultripes TaxID=61616 RepID=A0AAD1VZU8_PELCU|nr:Hypothetical predicted protein [Pelobates cultripes]